MRATIFSSGRPSTNKEEFNDESVGEVVGSITTVTNRIPNIPGEDRYEFINHTDSIYDDISDLEPRGGGMTICKRLEIKCK